MKKIWRTTSLLAGLPLLFSSLSVPAEVGYPPQPPLLPLTTVTQTGGSEVSFAKRVGQTLSRYSTRTEYEACANLCRSPSGNWIAQVVTIGSHAACLVPNACPSGTQDTGRLIHSHPSARTFIANESDFFAWRQPYVPNHQVQADDPSLFSESDFSRPGYLVVYGQLYYQNGPQAIEHLGMVSSP